VLDVDLVAQLSGGEKSRLLLGLATFEGPHLVILDEPTNHLDIDSRAALIEAVNAYAGAVIMVSHDRYLVEACADRLWLVADGTVAPFDGDMEDYRRLVLSQRRGMAQDDAKRSGDAPRAGRAALRRAAAEKRTELAPLRRRVTEIEAELARLHGEMTRLDAALAVPDLYTRDPALAAKLAKERSDAASALAQAEEHWLAASSAYEDANG